MSILRAVLRTALQSFCFLLCGAACYGLNSSSALTQYGRDTWGAEDGLPNLSVQSVLQTRDGYLWLATQGGLVRFDGARFTVFNTANTPSLAHNVIGKLFEDPRGRLWISTLGGGVTIYDHGRFSPEPRLPSRSGAGFTSVWVNGAGVVWAGIYQVGVLRLDGTQVTHVGGMPSGGVHALIGARDGSVWVGSYRGGLSRIRNGTVSTYTTRQGLPDNSVWSLHEDAHGVLWIGTDKGLAQFKSDSLVSVPLGGEAEEQRVSSLITDRDGNLWAGTRGGLRRMHEGSVRALTETEGLPDDDVHGVFEDREGSVWVGTEHGLTRLRDVPFQRFTPQEGFPRGELAPVIATEDGRIYFGLKKGGLASWRDGGTVEAIPEIDGLISSMALGHGGRLWLASPKFGLGSLENHKLRTFSSKDGYSIDPRDRSHVAPAWAVIQDRRGEVWVGTNGAGLLHWNGREFDAYTRKNGLPSDTVVALLEDHAGCVWVGTNAGLARISNGQVKTYTTQQGLAHPLVMSLYEDRDDILWVSTAGGLNRWKHGKFATFRSGDGLLEDTVLQVRDDDAGNLWIGSGRGICRVSKQALDSFVAGKVHSFSCTLFGVKDGLPSTNLSLSAQGAARGRDGRLWFATDRGLASVDPRRLSLNALSPPVFVEAMIAGNRPIALLGSTPELPPLRGSLELRYTALSLLRPDQVLFRYRLDGYDRDWQQAGTRRTAFYTNLGPGHYRFRVTACNNDGIWNETGATQAFSVLPHWYQTWWWYIWCLLLLGALLAAFYRLRLSAIEQRHKLVLGERTRLARELHDTLLQGFSGISWQLEGVSRRFFSSPEESKQRLDRLLKEVDRHLREARHTISYMRLSPWSEDGLAAALAQVGKQLTDGTQVCFSLQTSGLASAWPYTVESNVYFLAKEAIANAAAHSNAQDIRVELRYDPAALELTIFDNGCGFEVQEKQFAGRQNNHWGLIGMQERANQMNAAFTITSSPGQGTKVTLVVPRSATLRAQD